MASKQGPVEKGCIVGAVVVLLVLGSCFALRRVVSRSSRTVQKAYAETNEEFPFAPGADTRLTPERLDDYVAVRAAIVPGLQLVRGAIEAARAEKSREGGGAGLAFRMAKEMLRLHAEVGQDHVVALREHAMSVDEYRWIGRQALAALYQERGQPAEDACIPWAEIQSGFAQGAPRISKYRDSPPVLAERLSLGEVHPGREEAAAVRERFDGLVSLDVLYDEVALVLTDDEQASE